MSVYRSIADQVHKYIDIYDKVIIDIIDTWEFQRLRRIIQLGGVSAAYPSATHSRFMHSLGAHHVANRIGRFLNKKHPNVYTEDEIKQVSLTALIHDIGHGPFSHMFEDTTRLLCKNYENPDCNNKYGIFVRHENISEQIVLDGESEIAVILDREGYDRKQIGKLIQGKSVDDKPFKNQIINSQLDADALDYLMRDSVATGVSFGMYNLERLFDMMELTQEGTMLIREKGVQSIEQVVLALYMQFSRVYFHKTVRCYEYMLKLFISQMIQKIDEGKNVASLPFLKDFTEKPYWKTLMTLTDDVIYTQLHYSVAKEQNDDFIKKLANEILRRSLYKSIPLTEDMAAKVLENSEKINFIVRKHGYPTVSWDIDQFGSRYYTPYEETDRNAIMIKMKDGQLKQLSEVSDVIASLTKPKYNNLLIFPASCRKEISKLVEEI
ncbi:MAG: Deoxyguanosinetriphosphate triphosphohydrolase-like protein [Candidatus Heimdallarchaeota archaeon AB_125]|nr:MAG: Deoxyguanosinetriphosphate triphosphohydrolase-like protein [Candidatus Heimdallarchaeota archaeon AB_125]